MDNKIALEEHFSIPEIVDNCKKYFPSNLWSSMRENLLDFYDIRLSEMDKSGIERSLLSINAPGSQAILKENESISFSQRANDALAEVIIKRPDRFSGLASLPLQNVEASITELRRCIEQFNFKGILVNGYSQLDSADNAIYLDDERYHPFWKEVEELDVPFYLHPREPLESQRKIYDGHPWLLGPIWAFGVETATHALRLMGSGLFDKFPNLKVVLGHMGELLPYAIWRIDDRIGEIPQGITIKKTFGEYLRNNFYITTSAYFRTPALLDALMEMGSDHILFSTDYPFAKMTDAAAWFDRLELNPDDLLKMGRLNAINLFKL